MSTWSQIANVGKPIADAVDAELILLTAERDELQTQVDGLTAENTRLLAQLDTATARIAELEAQMPKPIPPTTTPPTTRYKFWVGADNNEGFGNNTLPAFITADKLIGPLKMRRSFPSLGSWGTAVAADKAAGYISFVSAGVPSGDYAGTAAGKYDAQITSACKGLPAGTHVTMNHEPENDVPGAVFVPMFRRFYQVAKAANPALQVGPAHLTYGWRNGVVGAAGNNTGTQPPSQWDVGDQHRDFTAADTYSVRGQALETDPQFRAWFNYFNTNSNKPLGIAEYGQYAVPPSGQRDPALEAKRADLIAKDAVWLGAQPKFTGMWLVWNGSGAQGNWKLQDQASIDAWKAVAARGRQV